MPESIKNRFSNKVFTIDDVKALARRFEDEAAQHPDNPHCDLEFAVSFDDESTKTEFDGSLFNDPAMNSKVIESISMTYRFYHDGTSDQLSLLISHGNSRYSSNNYWSVSGGREWVRGIEADIKDIVDGVKEQYFFAQRNFATILIEVLFVFLFAYLFGRVMQTAILLLPNINQDQATSWFVIVLTSLFGLMPSGLLNGFISDKISILFPQVEIRIGQKRLQMNERFKSLSKTVFAGFISPFCLEILLWGVKSYFSLE